VAPGPQRGARRVAACLVLTGASLLSGAAPAGARTPAEPIPEGTHADEPGFLGRPAVARPFPSYRVPRNRFMAPNGDSNIHDDEWQTDAYNRRGPLGRRMAVRSSFQGGDCASITFDSHGRIVAICVQPHGPKLVMLAPRSLDTLAEMPLPPRSGGGGGSVFSDFSGGGYFYLARRDRAVIPTNSHQIWVVGETSTPQGPGFELVRTYDLTGALDPDEGIISVLPDSRGRLWFATTHGLVGTVNRHSGAVHATRLEGESIGNSFAVDRRGAVYVVSDHALYRFTSGRDGAPRVRWRVAYDRGTRLKPGQANFGSGTTPTLFGRRPGGRFVAITDNADPRMHVLVYRRGVHLARRRLVCSRPVFAGGTGATENSLIYAAHSLIVENNYGYTGPASTEDGGVTQPGISRVVLDPGAGCHTAWTNPHRVPSTVSKVSLGTGLLYTYTKDPNPDGEDAWYLTAIGVRSGRTVYRRLAGYNLGFNNNFGAVYLGPDGHTAYVGVLGGVVELRDRVARRP
jgi:Two component regulator propeller